VCSRVAYALKQNTLCMPTLKNTVIKVLGLALELKALDAKPTFTKMYPPCVFTLAVKVLGRLLADAAVLARVRVAPVDQLTRLQPDVVPAAEFIEQCTTDTIRSFFAKVCLLKHLYPVRVGSTYYMGIF
jgi:hypothetical protein